MGVGERQIFGGCKRSENCLPEFPIALSENFVRVKRFAAQFGGCTSLPPTLMLTRKINTNKRQY